MKTEQFFRCLADNIRLKIVLLMWLEGELSISIIAQNLGVNENIVRRNIALLNKHQIVLFRQKELFQYCRINPDLPVWMSKTIKHTYRGNKKLIDEIVSSKGNSDVKLSDGANQKYSA